MFNGISAAVGSLEVVFDKGLKRNGEIKMFRCIFFDNVTYIISVSSCSTLEYYKTRNKKAIVLYCSTFFIVCTVLVPV